MSQHSGFFDALQVNGEYDRVYSAADYCDNLATIIKTGVRYSPDDDLKVTPAGGMSLSVGIGRAWINGHYYYNDTVYTGLTVPTAPTGTNKRIDRVVLRLDTSVSVRNITLALKQGTAAANPVAPAVTRSGDIYEIALADIYIDAAQTALEITDIVDQRENENVCGWAACVTPAIISLLKEYKWRTVITEATTKVNFFIPQYDADDVHILEVYTNGVRETAGEDYTVNADVITFANTKEIGAEIEVFLYKSIDGSDLASVADEVTELQEAMALLKTDGESVYLCNGVNDNVLLSQIAQAWLDGGTDYGSKKIRVVGNFGASAAYGGSGTSANPFRWISAGGETAKNRKIIFDFSACSQLSFPIAAGTYNAIFYGVDVHVIGANVVVNQTGAGTEVKAFSSAAGAVRAENCRFYITCYNNGVIANTGAFVNCRGVVTNAAGNSYCFAPLASSLLRVDGGEYYAYAVAGATSAVVGQSAADAVSIMHGVNAPTAAKSGYNQTHAILQNAGGGVMNCADLVSALAVSVIAGISDVRGTIAKSKAGAM